MVGFGGFGRHLYEGERPIQVGDLVQWKTVDRRNEDRLVNVLVTSLESFNGWVEVFDGVRTTAVPMYSLSHVGDDNVQSR